MSTLDQIIYRAPSGARGIILQAAASLQDPGSGDLWLRRLEPWLRAGGPLGRGYLNFGAESALIRWHDNTTSGIAWQFAHAVVGPSAVLTGSYALLVRELPTKLPSLPPDDRPLQVVDTDSVQLSHPGVIGARARSKEAIELLVPMLARVLAGEQRVVMPWTEWSLPEAVVWGLVSILDMLGDTRPVSYLTYAPGRPQTYPDCTFRSVPGPPRCRQTRGSRRWPSAWRPVTPTTPPDCARCLASTECPEKPTTPGRIARLLDVWPRPHQQAGDEPPTMVTPVKYQTATTPPGSAPTVNGNPDGQTPGTAALSTSANGGSQTG